MISYEPFWKTMVDRGATSYTVMRREDPNRIGSTTWNKLKAGGHISTVSIEKLCKMLDCGVEDIVTFKKSPE